SPRTYSATLCPYTTLFRSYLIENKDDTHITIPKDWASIVFEYEGYATARDRYYNKKKLTPVINVNAQTVSLNNYTFDYSILDNRSEEHTSELQSRENLVCR